MVKIINKYYHVIVVAFALINMGLTIYAINSKKKQN